ncbi:MAG: T9SS type A sorting domain-containing protein [Candidatus Marinimicrobia bacterium]|nr:T9SS type A sorting domain-containing protein [Candidatus Neomarinimicrobiota bacterium]
MKKTRRFQFNLLLILIIIIFLGTAWTDQVEGIRFAGYPVHQGNILQSPGKVITNLRDSVYSFPAPDTWPSGLAWDGTHLWLGGLADHQIYKLTPEGEVLGTLSGPDGGAWAYPAGLAWDGEYLWVVEEEGAVAYQVDTEADTIVYQFDLPSHDEYDANAWGIAWDGEYLWHGQYDTDAMIFKLDPHSGAVISSFIPPANTILGLAWKDDVLYGVDISSLTLFSLDPSSGATIDSQTWEIPYPLGLLWDGDYMWNVSSRIDYGGNQRVYKLSMELPPGGLGLVGKYLFNGDAFDYSGHEHHGLVFGTESTSDRFGTPMGALNFDGIDDHIDLGDALMLLSQNSPFSISAWVFPRAYEDVTQTVFGCSRNEEGFRLGYEPEGTTIEALLGYPASFAIVSVDTVMVPASDWSHLAITWSEADSLRLYIDGELEDVTEQLNWSYSGAYIDHLFIGADESEMSSRESSSFFDGAIDDVHIYDRVLSFLEVDSLYHINKIMMDLGGVDVYNDEHFYIPVNVIFPADSLYTSAEFHLREYMAGFEFIGVVTEESMLAGLAWDIGVDETEAELHLSFSGGSGVSGEGVFCYLEFGVLGEVCTTIPLSCEYTIFNSNHFIEETELELYINPVALYGDFNLDQTVDSEDASDLLTYLQIPGILDCQEMLNSDVFLDEDIQAMDAAIILGHLEGLHPDLPIIPGSTEFEAVADLNMEDIGAVAGDSITLPILLTEAANILSFRGTISYDPEVLDPTENLVTWSTLQDGFMTFSIEEPGLIELFGAGAYPISETGIFASLNFVVNSAFSVDNTTIVTIELLELNANLELLDISAVVTSVVSIDEPGIIPAVYSLSQNYPNPFNPTTTISYGLPEQSTVKLTIFDIFGQEVTTLLNTSKPPGSYDVHWNGSDDSGNPVSTGVYFCRLEVGDFSQTIKMLYLK